MAEEMRTLASCAANDRAREGLLNAADNYDRVAEEMALAERSRKFGPAKL
jgi:hypothetical protein